MIVKVLPAACLAALLAACGQRGPLFLPEEAPVEVRQTRGQTPATEPAEPATKEASEPSTGPATTEVPPQAEPAPKPDEPEEEKTGPDAGKPR